MVRMQVVCVSLSRCMSECYFVCFAVDILLWGIKLSCDSFCLTNRDVFSIVSKNWTKIKKWLIVLNGLYINIYIILNFLCTPYSLLVFQHFNTSWNVLIRLESKCQYYWLYHVLLYVFFMLNYMKQHYIYSNPDWFIIKK